ncbi:MAG: HYExAFE family protein [Phycisphaeraceae bacterium]|nr:MAG: HYExAFE family protein [Phycisphaeraceae bacterium]
MSSRRHYERAFEASLQRASVPYVLVDDARRAILEPGARLGLIDPAAPAGGERRLKSFDAVVYGAERHALVEVKGRRVDLRRGGAGRRECWTTLDDIRSLSIWEQLFGEPFEAVLVFMYWLDGPALNAREAGLVRFEGRVYAHRAIRLADYLRELKIRSPRWGTVDLPADAYERVGRTLGGLLARPPGAASQIEAAPAARPGVAAAG